MSQIRDKALLLLLPVVIVVALLYVASGADAAPQRKDVVLNIAGTAIPRWKQDVHKGLAELGALMGDKNKKIITAEDLDQFFVALDRIKSDLKDENEKNIPADKSATVKSLATAIFIMTRLKFATKKCNYQGYMYLVQAYEAAVGPKDYYLEPRNQVKSAVLTAIRLHGKICRHGYYGKFTEVYENVIHEVMLKFIDYVFDKQFLDEIFPKDDKQAIMGAKETILDITQAETSHLLLDKLRALTKNTEYEKYIVAVQNPDANGPKILVPQEYSDEVVTPLLIQPCEEFTEQLNDVFYPAMIDLAANDEKITEINHKNDERFMDIWKKFIICSAIHQNKDKIHEALKKVVQWDYLLQPVNVFTM